MEVIKYKTKSGYVRRLKRLIEIDRSTDRQIVGDTDKEGKKIVGSTVTQSKKEKDRQGLLHKIRKRKAVTKVSVKGKDSHK